MLIIQFLLNIAGATMLLLFAVRLVRTGIERSYGASFQRILTEQQRPAQASVVGLGLALILQSSAAVALLASGFAAGGLLAFGTGLAIVLGGDVGSALVIQLLSFDLAWLVPILLAVGGWLFVKAEQKKLRQAGRIIMGIALILVSLQFLRAAVEPIQGSAFLPAVSEYLDRDYITAFLVGAALAFLMHSSVAAILMCVTLIQIDVVSFSAGLSLVLGANLGSAFIPVWLTRELTAAARRIIFANLALRGLWALVILFAVNLLLDGAWLAPENGGQMLINAHIAFNTSLLLMALPFCKMLRAPFERLMPDCADPNAPQNRSRSVSALDLENVGTPTQALTSLKLELVYMIGLVETMFRPVMSLYKNGDKDQIRALKALEGDVNACLTRVRAFVAALPAGLMNKSEARTSRDLLEYAVRLETAGDVVAERFANLAVDMAETQCEFSQDGWTELGKMHDAILVNMKLASSVLISDDLESARLLNTEKTEMKRSERKSRKRHFKRLQSGKDVSLESSDIHLETLRALRDFNSNIAAVATPILYANGQLLETRLIEEMPVWQKDGE
jgi:phosphate:Na+ symporter